MGRGKPGDYMDGAAARTAAIGTLTEKAFQAQVVALARTLGWQVYHPFDSRRSTPGFPDLTLVRDRRLVFAELKTERGRVTAAQRGWLDALGGVAAAADCVEVYLWRPSDWDDIERILSVQADAPVCDTCAAPNPVPGFGVCQACRLTWI